MSFYTMHFNYGSRHCKSCAVIGQTFTKNFPVEVSNRTSFCIRDQKYLILENIICIDERERPLKYY